MTYRSKVATVFLLGFFLDLINMFIASVAFPAMGDGRGFSIARRLIELTGDVTGAQPAVRLVKTIGAVAVPTALILLPRLTASQDWPVDANRMTPGWMVSVTAVSVVSGVAQPIVVEV